MGLPDTNFAVKKGRRKKKHAGGRPSKFSAELGVSICSLLRKGCSRKDACAEVGITYPSMYSWLKRGETEKDLDEIKRTEFFRFWDSVHAIESSKSGLCGVSKPSNNSDPRKPEAGVVLETCSAGSDEQYQTECYNVTINGNPFILKTPTDKQRIFLLQGIPKRNIPGARIKPFEVFFNGALKSGKTTGLIMAALQYVHQGNYRALLVRPDYNNLESTVMRRVNDWLIKTGARWKKKDLTWYFPSGARLTLSYLHNVKKDHKFDHRYYDFIGCDDLTGFEREEYQKLITLLHPSATTRLPVRICSTGNSFGGENTEWIKDRFITMSPEEMAKINRYTVSAVIEENPYINPVAERMRYKRESPLIQAQLFDCSWDRENPNQ
jgi:hypothetical protein